MDRHKDVESAFNALSRAEKTNPRERDVAELSKPEELAQYLLTERESLHQRILHPPTAKNSTQKIPPPGLELAHQFSDLMDCVLQRIFSLACGRHGADPATVSMAIIASGGYGRRELCPYSDVDMTFVPFRDKDPQLDRVIKDTFQMLMDVCSTRCKMEIGYSYHPLDDYHNLDHQTICALLDARLLAGSTRVYVQFQDAYWDEFNSAEFIFTKIVERNRMHEKWGNSPRIVEPQIKEGVGGLRDLQTMVWLVQAREQLEAARVRGDRSFHILEHLGNVTPQDIQLLQQAKEMLFQTRNALHALSKAERDIFSVTKQEEVAILLGYCEESVPPRTPPVEVYMSQYYANTAHIARVARQVTHHVENSRLIMGIGMDCRRKQLVTAKDKFVSDDPVWMLWAFEMLQRYNLELGESLEQRILNTLRTQPALTDGISASQGLTQILSCRGKIYPIVQIMADLGVLGWLLPEFEALMNLIPYDPSHDHTVGQHTLYVIQNLEALLTLSGDEETSTMRGLFVDLPHPEHLLMAALLHDAGKAHPGRPHALVGEDMARETCKRFGWSEEATANVCFLVRNHLYMAEVSRLRDLDREETIRDFIQVVDDVDRLNMLYLLTYADTKAVGEGVWTQVKGRFLFELWRKSMSLLSAEEVPEPGELMTRARRRLVRDLSHFPPEEVEEHVQAMPPSYLLGQTFERMALHIGFVRRVREREIVVEFHEEKNATYTELTVCVFDDPNPGLLAKITGVLYAAGLEVHSANVVTRASDSDRIALDTLWVDYRERPLTPSKQKEVKANLTAVLSGTATVQSVLDKAGTKTLLKRDVVNLPVDLPVELFSFRNDLSDTLTIIEIGSTDIRSTLYRVADAVSKVGWDIQSAKISVWHGIARASLYVAGARSLSEAEARNALTQVILLK